MLQGQDQEAFSSYLRAVELGSNYIADYINASSYASLFNNIDLGIRIAYFGLRLFPNNPDLLVTLGTDLSLIGKFDQAINFLNKSISIDSNLLGYICLSECYRIMEDNDSATSTAQIGLKIHQDSTELQLRLSQGLLAQKKYNEAIDEFKKVLLNKNSDEKDKANAIAGIGAAQYKLGNYIESANCFNLSLGFSENCPGAYMFMGDLLMSLDITQLGGIPLPPSLQSSNYYEIPTANLFLAFKSYLKAISLAPYDFHNLRVFCQNIHQIFQQTNIETLIHALEQEFQADPSLVESGYILADLLDFHGDQKHSEETLSRIIDLMVQDPKVRDRLRPIGVDSLNDVYVDTTNMVSENTIVIKRSKAEHLQREHAITSFVWDTYSAEAQADDKKALLTSEKLKTTKPIRFFRHIGGDYFLVTKHARKPNLIQLIERETPLTAYDQLAFEIETNSDVPEQGRPYIIHYGKKQYIDGKDTIEHTYKESIKSIAKLHGLITNALEQDEQGFYFIHEGRRIDLPVYNCKQEFMTRAILGRPTDKNKRLGYPTYNYGDLFHLDMFVDNYLRFLEQFKGEPRTFIHSDLKPDNILEGGIIIDYEKACIGNPMLDLTLFLTSPRFNLPEYIAQRNIVSDYANEITNYLPLAYPGLLPYARPCQLHNALCFLGTSLAKGDNQAANYYINVALNLMEGDLKGSFTRYIETRFRR